MQGRIMSDERATYIASTLGSEQESETGADIEFRDPIKELGWAKIDHILTLDTTLSDGAYRTYAILCYYWQRKHAAWANVQTMATVRGVKESTLRSHLKELCDAELITRKRRMGQSSMTYLEDLPNRYAEGAKTVLANRQKKRDKSARNLAVSALPKSRREEEPLEEEPLKDNHCSDSKIESLSPSQEYSPQAQTVHILKEELQPCGHNISAIVSTDEGTHYCGECVAAAPPVCKKHNRGMLLNDGKYRCADCDFEEMPSVGAGMTPQPHTAGTADPQAEHREMITALAEVMHQATQCNGGKLAKTAQKLLRVPGVTPARIREWYGGPCCWWMLNDWRGQRGQAPDISAINATVAMARDGIRPDISGYGHGAPKESRLDQLQRVLGVRIDGKSGIDSKNDDGIIDGIPVKVI
jgi:DNA-binding transcriptional ArsR family regulator